MYPQDKARINYGLQKFCAASTGLKKSELNPRESLENAYCFHISLVKDHNVPEVCVERLRELQRELTLPEGTEPIGGNSGCKYKISSMSDEEVNRLTSLIHEIYSKFESIHE